jgi:hypothetical protein
MTAMTMTTDRPAVTTELRMIGRRAHRMVDTDTVVLTCDHIASDTLADALRSVFGTVRPRVDQNRIVTVPGPAKHMLSPAILPFVPTCGLDVFVRGLEMRFTGTQHRHVLVIDHEGCPYLDRHSNQASALALLAGILRRYNGRGYPTSAYLVTSPAALAVAS